MIYIIITIIMACILGFLLEETYPFYIVLPCIILFVFSLVPSVTFILQLNFIYNI